MAATGPSDFNYASLMSVVAETQEDERGVFIPAHLMPTGTAVRGDGATKAQLAANREMVEMWTGAVRSEYERQEKERNHVASIADVPDLVIDGGATPAEQPGRSEVAAAPVVQTLEEELQARCKRWDSECQRLGGRLQALEAEYLDAKTELKKCEAALDAVR
jgi:hypothetical protein